MRGLRLALALGMLLFLTGCPNLHEVKRGELYRSGQLDKKQLRAVIEKAGIKTIINLRGSSDEDWYQDEKAVAQAYGVNLVNIKMSAKRLPTRAGLIKLLETYRNAPRPILIHCKAGVDRTGEAATIYAMEYLGQSKKKALEQLSPKYFHVPKLMPAKTYFIRNIYQGEAWAYREYHPCQTDYKYFNKASACDEFGNEHPPRKSDDVFAQEQEEDT